MGLVECLNAKNKCTLSEGVSCDGEGVLTRKFDAKIGGYEGKLTEFKRCPKYVTRESQVWRQDYQYYN